MFDQIHFLSYRIPKAVTPISVEFERIANQGKLPLDSPLHDEEIPDNMQNADYYLAGNIDIFTCPPLSAEVKQNLYHMEAFSVFHCESHFFTQREKYRSYLLLFTYEGCGQLEYQGKVEPLPVGSGFFIDCMLPHTYRTLGSHWKHSVLHINGPLLSQFYPYFLTHQSPVFYQSLNGTYQNQLENLLRLSRSNSPHRDWLVSTAISQILNDLLTAPSSSDKDQPPLIKELQNLIYYMEENFSQALSLDDLANIVGISKFHLSHSFKDYTGFAPNDYLIRLRIEHAKSLLLSTALPTNKIASIVGIRDVNNFNNLFKKKTGMTPGLYRRQRSD